MPRAALSRDDLSTAREPWSAPTSASSRAGACRRLAPLGAARPSAGAAPSSTRPACSTGRCSRACARSPAGTTPASTPSCATSACDGLLRGRRDAAAGAQSGAARCRRPGRGLLARRSRSAPTSTASRRRSAASSCTSRAPPTCRGSTMRARQQPARRRRDRHRRAARLGLRVRRRRRPRRCCASATWSTSSSRCRTRFYEVRRDPLRGLLGAATARRRPSAACRCGRCRTTARTSAPSRTAIFLRILAHALLGFEERDEWRALTGHGAAQARVAVRPGGDQGGGADGLFTSRPDSCSIPPTSRCCTTSSARPSSTAGGAARCAEAPQVSLSHTARACLVAVGRAESPVGVDLEELGRIQQPELMVESLTAGERAAVDGLAGAALDERLLRLWCAKEAAAKCLGIGLQGQPEALRGPVRRRRLRARAGRLRGRDDRGRASCATAPR